MDKLSLREFLTSLAKRLDELSKQELAALILARAREVPSKERLEFLEGFRPIPAPESKSLPRDDEKDFLADIEDFTERVGEGAFVEGQGWDNEVRCHRTFGDESWADELEELLAEARAHYAAGHFRIARVAFEKLLATYHDGLEEGKLPGSDPADMLTVDLEEEALRYLRCVYLTEGTLTRPSALWEAIENLGYAGRKLGLRAMLSVDTRALPEWESFGADWIDHLKSVPMNRFVSTRLAEGVELFQGTAGLEAAAREKGAESASLYLAWVEALGREGRRQEAGVAAIAALSALPGDLSIRARLADFLVAAGRDLGKSDWVEEGLREALRADVSLARLMDSVEAEMTFEGRVARTAEALARIEELEAARGAFDGGPPRRWQPDLALAAVQPGLDLRARLLMGRYEEAASRLSEASPKTWQPSEDTTRLLIPFFLFAGCSRERPLSHNLTALWHDAVGYQDYRFSSESGTENEPAGARFARALEVTLNERPIGEQDLDRYFGLALATARATVDEIVSSQARATYDRAARLIAAAAEVYAGRGEAEKGRALLSAYHERYSRYAAFRKELKVAAHMGGFIL